MHIHTRLYTRPTPRTHPPSLPHTPPQIARNCSYVSYLQDPRLSYRYYKTVIHYWENWPTLAVTTGPRTPWEHFWHSLLFSSCEMLNIFSGLCGGHVILCYIISSCRLFCRVLSFSRSFVNQLTCSLILDLFSFFFLFNHFFNCSYCFGQMTGIVKRRKRSTSCRLLTILCPFWRYPTAHTVGDDKLIHLIK